MKLIKAGESHGEAMVGILYGVPAGIPIDKQKINSALKERNFAYGRSGRQAAENDEIALLTGEYNGKTNGNNIAFVIENSVRSTCTIADGDKINEDFDGNKRVSSLENLRPGHADLSGILKFGFSDARPVAEGASARNTCLDVAAGCVALAMLKELGIEVFCFVRSVGMEKDDEEFKHTDIVAPFFALSDSAKKRFKTEVDGVAKRGDTAGGTVELRAINVKAGFGHYTAKDRINGVIARDLQSIQAVKGVYFGKNPFNGALYGSEYADEISFDRKAKRIVTCNSGGVDGGMTNGAEIVVTVGVKPIPTTVRGVPSVDVYGNKCISARERADVTAVFALCPILKARFALTLCDCLLERLGTDNMKDISARYKKLDG